MDVIYSLKKFAAINTKELINVRTPKAILAACTILMLAVALTGTSAMAQISPPFPIYCNQNGMYYRAILATDTNNCGGCGLICPAGSPCKSGKCVDSVCAAAKRKLIKVNQNLNDTSAFHTIQKAVDAAKPCDTISVAAGTYKENVRVDKSLAIKGAGERWTTVDGGQGGLVFEIGSTNPSIKVTLSDIKIQNGLTVSNGGGILNSGNLLLSNCNITGNQARNGGGIYNVIQGFSTLKVSNSTICGNKAADCGGGIFNWGSAAISGAGSKITGNSAFNAGGGIYNWGDLTVSGSTISGNFATTSGGGLFNWGYSIVGSGSTISWNNAANNGGGIFSARSGDSHGYIELNDCTLIGNIASGNGGGVYNEATAIINRCAVGPKYLVRNFGNTARYGGGICNFGGLARLDVMQSTVFWNRATIDGGGVYSQGAQYFACDSKQVLHNIPNDKVEI